MKGNNSKEMCLVDVWIKTTGNEPNEEKIFELQSKCSCYECRSATKERP